MSRKSKDLEGQMVFTDLTENEENIQDVDYTEVMNQSYIDYAMSVITDRAVPDVRDGLKPVQRRILYDMAELGLFSDKPYKKCARIVGDTMGKYHPHGDSSIQGALVVMAQDFKYGTPLVDGHGNFGSIEGDPAAAQRYIEAKLKPLTETVMLADLKNGAVPYRSNYDETEKEPEVLPCKIPNFLINGSDGIAVGMVTSTPPHNLSETIDAAIHYLDHPESSTQELLEILKGPDFPTGGIIANKSELLSIYETGKGKIRIRGKVVFEKGGSGQKDRLVITEIPYTMIGNGIAKFLQTVADLVEDKTLSDITDITNQTSSEGIRIVLELKKNADVEYIKSVLYKKTKLEDTYGVNMLAISHQKPRILSLRQVMQDFAEFQYEIYEKKYTKLLADLEHQIGVNEGLLLAVDVIDTIIAVLRGSKNVKMARECLKNGETKGIQFKSEGFQKEAESFRFTEAQASAILEMRLTKLIGLEIDQLKSALSKQLKEAKKYKKILGSKTEMRKEIIKELCSIKEKFGTGRKTEILDAGPVIIPKKEEPEMPVTVLVDRFGYVHTVEESVYQRYKETADSEYSRIVQVSNKGKLLIFTDAGMVHSIKVSALPRGKIRDKGQPIDNLCGYDGAVERIVGIHGLNQNETDQGKKLLFVSSDGLLKLTDIMQFDITRRSAAATKLNESQTLVHVGEYQKNGMLILLSSDDLILKIQQDPIPEKKKLATGTAGMKLNKNAFVKAAAGCSPEEERVTLNNQEVNLAEIKPGRRGTRGTQFLN